MTFLFVYDYRASPLAAGS